MAKKNTDTVETVEQDTVPDTQEATKNEDTANTGDTAQETVTLAEAADFLNRSIGYFNADRKAILVERGATLGGRGVGSSIPRALLDELASEGWKDDRARSPRAPRGTGTGDLGDVDAHPFVQEAFQRIDTANKREQDTKEAWERAKEEVKLAKKNLTVARREATADLKAQVKKPTKAEQALADIEEQEKALAKEQAKLEKKKARALAKLTEKED